jgi:hypothetical protein
MLWKNFDFIVIIITQVFVVIFQQGNEEIFLMVTKSS